MADKPSDTEQRKRLEEIVEEVGVYPIEAYEFVRQGLSFTVSRLHGNSDPDEPRHVSGQDLSAGLRDYAIQNWGMLARTVLERWNITSTFDFGRIVFAMIAAGWMHKTDSDTIEDFRNVYDFKTAFDVAYKFETKP